MFEFQIFDFEYVIFNLNSKRLIWSKNWYLNLKLIFLNPKTSILIRKLLIYCTDGHFNFEYFNMNIRISISTFQTFHLNFK
jgi:hypothetical protein